MVREEKWMDPVFALAEDDRVVHANEAATEWLGRDGEVGEDEDLWPMVSKPERGRLREALDQARETGETTEVEVPARREDRWYRIQVFPMDDVVSLHLRDITAEKDQREELRLREQALRDACETVAETSVSPRDKIKRLLTVIRGTLGTEFATLSHVDPEEETYHFDAVGIQNEDALPEGETVPLSELPVCARVAETEETLVLEDVEEQAPDLVDPEWGIEAYVGAPIEVRGDVYGTFCFYSTERRTEAFTDWEVTYVELFADFASTELERLALDADPTRPPLLSPPPSRAR